MTQCTLPTTGLIGPVQIQNAFIVQLHDNVSCMVSPDPHFACAYWPQYWWMHRPDFSTCLLLFTWSPTTRATTDTLLTQDDLVLLVHGLVPLFCTQQRHV